MMAQMRLERATRQCIGCEEANIRHLLAVTPQYITFKSILNGG
jgi:hypothetical protein